MITRKSLKSNRNERPQFNSKNKQQSYKDDLNN